MQINWIKRFQNLLLSGCAVLLMSLYSWGALENASRINVDIDRVDQGAYLAYASNLYETDYNYVGGRNRMPVYPFLLSYIYNPDFTDTDFFTRGKSFNIALSAALLPGIFWLLRDRLPLLLSINLWLILTFTVFIFKAGYVQVELLFYVLTFCGFLLMWQMLKRPSWQLGILTGIVLGITYLTKASILPGLAIFIAVFLLKIGTRCFSAKQDQNQALKRVDRLKQEILPDLLSLILVVSVFLGTIYPYINTSYRFFGHYFYNVNSTFYIWYDSWEEAEAGTRMQEDGKGFPQMPPEDIPSLSKYLREHTASQIIYRFSRGCDRLYAEVSRSYGYFKYVVIYLAIALIVSLVNFRSTLILVQNNAFLLLFLFIYFIVYFVLYAWYSPIASGSRFILSQLMPLMFLLSMILNIQSIQHPVVQILRWRLTWLHIVNLLILGMILFELPTILLNRILITFAAT